MYAVDRSSRSTEWVYQAAGINRTFSLVRLIRACHTGLIQSLFLEPIYCKHLKLQSPKATYETSVIRAVVRCAAPFVDSCCFDYRTTQLYVGVVLGIVILSVCPSVRLPVCHTRALWQNQTMYCGYFWYRTKGQSLYFSGSTVVGERRPLPSEMCAENDPPLLKTPISTGFRL